MDNLIGERVRMVRDSIREAAVNCGRDPATVTLMAVTKFHPMEAVRDAIDAGITCFGENRVQEARDKFEGRSDRIELHLIGHLQRNKAKIAASIFDWVQSIDRAETARALDTSLEQNGRDMDILIEVNTSGEESKSGLRSDDELFKVVDDIGVLKRLRVRGLMTIAPFTKEEKPIRTSFSRLRLLFEQLRRRYPELPLDTLSMGMSNDFRIAIEEGSNLVRIGTAIFGERSV
ncbi:MAG TPA: YggS family pyridoxal phosphate-dependent enzyme [Spirochaetia bacterium]|nr:YggS family pyridoxal phosphate-dependent enzyme [Spirochaetia bacterium]